MTAEPEIRSVPADDPVAAAMRKAFADELVALYGEFDPGAGPSATPADFGPPGGMFFVVYDGDEPVACGGVKRWSADTGEIKRMYVVPDARSQGHARRILGALEDAARALGYSRIRLDTGPRQHHAKALYPSAGYVAIPDYNGNPYASLWFEKRL